VATVAEDDGSFLSRWSRRKTLVREGQPVRAEPVEAPPAKLGALTIPARTEEPVRAEPAETCAPKAPSPTLDDVAALTKDSDFSRFVAKDTDPAVKNAALKKLFASDPHFNTMDGLDVYIDDYNRFEPIPRNLMRQLVNARAMGLLDDELPEQPATHNPAPDEDPDLQLQPDDAAGRGRAGEGLADGGPGEPTAPDPVPPRGA
jgi:hypothetical protein